MSTVKIGWVGLGNMGIPMSGNLIKAGYEVVVYNRSKEKEEALQQLGAATALSPAALMQLCDVIFVMVSDDKAIREIFLGDEGLLSTSETGKVVVNMSTVSPRISKEMAVLCKEKGNDYLDAPVSGSVKQAQDAQLVIMIGGEQSVYEQAKPMLERLGKMTMLVGSHGAGNTAKLAINALLGIQAQALAEAVAFARNNGIATQDLLTLLNNGALGSIFMKIKGDAILQENFKAAFALKHIVKDLALAKDEGLDYPLGEAALHTYQQAEPMLGEEDIISIIKYIDMK